MSLLDKLFGLFSDGTDSSSTVVEHPCSNCPSSCSIAPAACSVCQPFKEQMIDAIYRVEHKDEILEQYEVAGISAQEGAVVCPHCGGTSDNPYICDYCGSKLQDGSGKIKVASAADLPNPVLEAQDIIFRRYDAVRGYVGADSGYGYEDALSGVGSQGLLSSIFSAFMGTSSSSDSYSIGNRMTEEEIKEMADYYDVSVSEYLTGLDNGKYLTLSNKTTAAKAEETYTSTHQTTSSSGGLSDLTGLAGAMGIGSLLFGGSRYNRSVARTPRQPVSARPVQDPYRTAHAPSQAPRTVQSVQKPDPRMEEAAKKRSLSPADPRHGSDLHSPDRQEPQRTAAAPSKMTAQKIESAPPKAAAQKAAPAPVKAASSQKQPQAVRKDAPQPAMKSAASARTVSNRNQDPVKPSSDRKGTEFRDRSGGPEGHGKPNGHGDSGRAHGPSGQGGQSGRSVRRP